MKKVIILSVCVVVLVTGFFIFKSNKSVAPAGSNQPKFFGADKILPTDIVIKIIEKGFEPAKTSIKKGQRVVWINEAVGYSWPASDLHPTHGIYPEFDPKEPLGNGEVWMFTFDRAGVWGYHNHMRSSDRGVVEVSI